ncbi:MAG: hypothetical protein AABX33_02700 [Nanoarchaeota archaeon]
MNSKSIWIWTAKSIILSIVLTVAVVSFSYAANDSLQFQITTDKPEYRTGDTLRLYYYLKYTGNDNLDVYYNLTYRHPNSDNGISLTNDLLYLYRQLYCTGNADCPYNTNRMTITPNRAPYPSEWAGMLFYHTFTQQDLEGEYKFMINLTRISNNESIGLSEVVIRKLQGPTQFNNINPLPGLPVDSVILDSLSETYNNP